MAAARAEASAARRARIEEFWQRRRAEREREEALKRPVWDDTAGMYLFLVDEGAPRVAPYREGLERLAAQYPLGGPEGLAGGRSDVSGISGPVEHPRALTGSPVDPDASWRGQF